MSTAAGASDAASPVRSLATEARAASRVLASLNETTRRAALARMAEHVLASAADLQRSNAEDLRSAAARTGDAALTPAVMARLRLDLAKVTEMAEQIRSVATLPDPLGVVLDRIELDSADPATVAPSVADAARGLHLEKVSVPLGVLAVVFEARPDAVTQIAALALMSGNAVVMKAGQEVQRTATALAALLRAALASMGLPAAAISLLPDRAAVAELLQAHDLVDLVIPRGSKQLVDYVQANTRIPVLGHSEGVCHIYVDRHANPALALRVIADAKLDYPAACNAVETVLVHRDLAQSFLPDLARALAQAGVQLHGDAEALALMRPIPASPVDSWHREFGEAELSIGVVSSLDAAIAHIHTYGSAHTESILTEDPHAAEQFLREVDAAGVFHNVSTRFADGFRYGFGAEVGISTSKLHARGPVGLAGLTTYKYLLRGRGHVAGEYRGAHARSFTHRRTG